MAKDFFRCNVCNDIHYGVEGPGLCPTCQSKNAYVVVELSEARFVLGL